jgi:Activator of Hsp90 ATPase homolog 1-like protein
MASLANESMSPIVKTIMIEASQQTVFNTFVAKFGSWWPRDRFVRSSGGALPTVVLEACVGGAIFELTETGARLEWGTVTAIEQDRFIRMQWHLGRPVETVVEVTFEKVAPDQTRVILTHSGWEALEATGATVERASYDKGWDMILAHAFVGAFNQTERAE